METMAPSHAAPLPRGDRDENPRGIGLLALLAEDYRTHGRKIEAGFLAERLKGRGAAR
jgi:hypothetical protein